VKIVRILKFIAINIVVLAVLLVALNWSCSLYLKKTGKVDRALLPNYAKDLDHAKAVFADYHRIKHRYEPFVGWKTLPYQGETTHISADGLRTHQPETNAPDIQKVVRFFGGSTMWGEGSDDAHTIPALFNALNPEYTVYNHGQLAYDTRQELDDLISTYSRNEKADLVIFYDGVNEAAFLCPKIIKELPAHRLVPLYQEKLFQGKLAMIKSLAVDIFVDDIMKVIQKTTYKPAPGSSPYDCISDPGKAEAIAEMMMKNWEMAYEIVTQRHGQFIAVLQPAAFIGKPRIDHLALDEELGNNFREIYRILSEKIAARNHPWIVDLSHKFDGDEYIFIDFCHVSPNGNEIIAREISRAIKDSSGLRNF